MRVLDQSLKDSHKKPRKYSHNFEILQENYIGSQGIECPSNSLDHRGSYRLIGNSKISKSRLQWHHIDA